MAKRKKAKSTKRRRRMSGPGKMDLITPAAVIAGAAGGTFLVNGPLKTESWSNIAVAAGGLAMSIFMKSPSMKAVGYGLAAAGAVSMLQNANIISGIGTAPFYVGLPGGAGPISAIAGGRRVGNVSTGQRNAAAIRNAANRNGQVILNGLPMKPISAIAGAVGCNM